MLKNNLLQMSIRTSRKKKKSCKICTAVMCQKSLRLY